MKKSIFHVLVLSFLGITQFFGQSTVQQNLDNTIQTAESIKLEVKTARKGVNQLVKELTIIGNPNAVLF